MLTIISLKILLVFSEVELRVTVETNGNAHIQMIIDEFNKLGYTITKIINIFT